MNVGPCLAAPDPPHMGAFARRASARGTGLTAPAAGTAALSASAVAVRAGGPLALGRALACADGSHRLAPTRPPTLVGMEEPPTYRATDGASRHPHADSHNGASESAVGRAELSPRTFGTFPRELPSRRRPLPIVLQELSGAWERPMIISMPTTARPQQRYDHRLRNLVQRTGDVTVATDLGVPRSTARGWLGKTPNVVVGLDVTDLTASELHQEVLELRRRVKKLTALLRLALALLRSSGFTLTHERLPDGRAKIRILSAVDRAREFVPLRGLLRFLRLSPSRFHAWRRLQHACALDDQSSCPRTSPHRLTPAEVRAIRDW